MPQEPTVVFRDGDPLVDPVKSSHSIEFQGNKDLPGEITVVESGEKTIEADDVVIVVETSITTGIDDWHGNQRVFGEQVVEIDLESALAD
jgi:hypothetical protein